MIRADNTSTSASAEEVHQNTVTSMDCQKEEREKQGELDFKLRSIAIEQTELAEDLLLANHALMSMLEWGPNGESEMSALQRLISNRSDSAFHLAKNLNDLRNMLFPTQHLVASDDELDDLLGKLTEKEAV